GYTGPPSVSDRLCRNRHRLSDQAERGVGDDGRGPGVRSGIRGVEGLKGTPHRVLECKTEGETTKREHGSARFASAVGSPELSPEGITGHPYGVSTLVESKRWGLELLVSALE